MQRKILNSLNWLTVKIITYIKYTNKKKPFFYLIFIFSLFDKAVTDTIKEDLRSLAGGKTEKLKNSFLDHMYPPYLEPDYYDIYLH